MSMIPFGNQTITLYHKGADGYSAHRIGGCSLRQTARRAANDRSVTAAVETVCRIPADGLKPEPGDMIAPGTHEETVKNDVELVRLLDRLRAEGAFRVLSVSDNTRGAPIPHFAARGE